MSETIRMHNIQWIYVKTNTNLNKYWIQRTMLSSLGLCTKDKLTSYNEKKITSITAQTVVHLEDFMVNLSRYKLSPINYKLQHQLVWSAPEWMDRKRHSRDFSPRATLFRYCLTWFRLKEKDYKVVTTVISSFQNERQASHFKFNIFHRWALTLPVPLGTWSREPVGTKEGGIWPKKQFMFI